VSLLVSKPKLKFKRDGGDGGGSGKWAADESKRKAIKRARIDMRTRGLTMA
jgi:hypothetical protein